MLNDKERYIFDLTGYLLIEDVLSPAELRELNALIDGYDVWEQHGNSRVQPESLGLKRSENKVSVDPLHKWGEPFRRLIDHPRVLPYLVELIGPQFRYDHGYAIFMKKGGEKLRLHGGATPYEPGMFYHCYNGRMYNGLIVVTYALTDVGPGDGGFAVVPGSHKSNFPCPETYREFEETGPWLQQVPHKAGSAIIFTEALTHGTWPWTADSERRALLYKFSPGHMAWARRYPMAADVPDAGWSPQLERILQPPHMQARAKVVAGDE